MAGWIEGFRNCRSPRSCSFSCPSPYQGSGCYFGPWEPFNSSAPAPQRRHSGQCPAWPIQCSRSLPMASTRFEARCVHRTRCYPTRRPPRRRNRRSPSGRRHFPPGAARNSHRIAGDARKTAPRLQASSRHGVADRLSFPLRCALVPLGRYHDDFTGRMPMHGLGRRAKELTNSLVSMAADYNEVGAVGVGVTDDFVGGGMGAEDDLASSLRATRTISFLLPPCCSGFSWVRP